MKRSISLTIYLLAAFQFAAGQTALTLEQCYERAEANYPLVRQRELIERTGEFSIENAAKGSLPQISIGGQATYQSEVTMIPLEMPGIEPLSKDQYRIFGEVSQTLYNGGLVSARRELEEATAESEERKFEVELYQVQSRIDDLFFGILLLQEQAAQTELVRLDLRTGLKKVEAAIANGTALRTDADAISAELLKMDQRVVETKSTTNAYRHMLGLFIGQAVDDRTILEKPSFAGLESEIRRPELEMFDAQKQMLQFNETMLSATRRPRLDLFVQGGYGRPGLNMLENEFSFYYLGGIRFSWLISGQYTLRREKQILDLRRQTVDARKEAFLFDTNLALIRHGTEIARLRRLIEVDDEIIALRTRIRTTAEVQLGQGVMSSSDFIREVNAEDQAKQSRVLHETQLLLAQAKHRFTSGQN